MSSLIHTDDLEAGERFEFWRESVSETWVPMECFTDNETGFWAQVRTGGLGAVKVNLMTAAPHGVRRTRRLIRQADPDLLKVLILLSGDCVISQDDRQAHLGPADFVLYDTRRPYWARTVGADGRPIQALTFLFPRSLLPLPPGQLNRLTATRMAAGRGVGPLTSEFLVQLARNLEHYRPAEATRLATAALQILATRLAHQGDIQSSWLSPTHSSSRTGSSGRGGWSRAGRDQLDLAGVVGRPRCGDPKVGDRRRPRLHRSDPHVPGNIWHHVAGHDGAQPDGRGYQQQDLHLPGLVLSPITG